MKALTFSGKLLEWHDVNGRTGLPWQEDKSPYRVWVSEIMLQQTQVATVIPYYQRFMKTFPTVSKLASAHQDIVLEHWAGLGYYSRARNLHKAAQLICEEFNGQFPQDIEGLLTLPGIGKSTAGAILSIAMGVRAPILDGNVKRVLARFHGVRTWPGEKPSQDLLWQYADQHTPQSRNAQYTQAIMDLGATLCVRKKPNCLTCPLMTECVAAQNNLTDVIPAPKPRREQVLKKVTMLHCVDEQNNCLLIKRPDKGVWGGLYSFPECDPDISDVEIKQQSQLYTGAPKVLIEQESLIKHTFTHFKLEAKVVMIRCLLASHPDQETQGQWLSLQALRQIALPAPLNKYLLRSDRSSQQSELAL